MIASAIPTLVLIGLAAVLAPLTDEALRRFVAVPEVVILILFGVMLRPSVLGLAHTNTIVTALRPACCPSSSIPWSRSRGSASLRWQRNTQAHGAIGGGGAVTGRDISAVSTSWVTRRSRP
jgi:hypothetical protein